MGTLEGKVEQAIREKAREILAERRNLYILPSPYLSLFFEGCVEKEKDISLGCRYNNWGFHGTGLAPAADMLAAVDAAVFHGSVTPERLLDAMAKNMRAMAVENATEKIAELVLELA